MNVQTLYQTGAYAPGSECWIIPDLSASKWSRSIDWYLNLQFSKAKLHQPQPLDETLKNIASENQIPQPVPQPSPTNSETKPLMIASSSQLPTSKVVEMPKDLEPKQWITQAHEIWLNLDRPTLRLFLPPGLDAQDVQALWPTEDTSLSVVNDLSRKETPSH